MTHLNLPSRGGDDQPSAPPTTTDRDGAELAKGTRVRHAERPARLGTVVAIERQEAKGVTLRITVRVDWDMVYGETLEEPRDLIADAPMPDPAFALHKALRYRHQRDRALEDVARIAGLEAEFAGERVAFHEAIADAREEAGLAIRRMQKARDEMQDARDAAVAWRELAEMKLAQVAELATLAGGYTNDGRYVELADALDRIVKLVVDIPTGDVAE